MSGAPTAARFDLDLLGRWVEGDPYEARPEAIRAYAEATNETAPAALKGRVAPPVFAIVPVWDAVQQAATAISPDEARPYVVHGEQDILVRIPIEAGMSLRSRAAAVGVHVKGSGTTVVLKAETRDADDRLLGEQYVTEFYRGVTGGESAGDTAPGRDLPRQDGSRADAEVSYAVDEDQSYRYADASGDCNPIHLDEQTAHAAGLPGIIVHGLCLLAFAERAVRQVQSVDDPAAVRRLAVRFSRPMAPGGELTTRIRRLADGAQARFAFDCVDPEGNKVLRAGLAELDVRPPGR